MTLETFIETLKTHVDNTEITPESLLLDDLGLDSFRMMEIVYEYEKKGYIFDFGESKPIITVQDLFHIMRTAGEIK